MPRTAPRCSAVTPGEAVPRPTVTAVGPPSPVSALSAVVADPRGERRRHLGCQRPERCSRRFCALSRWAGSPSVTPPPPCAKAPPRALGGPVASGWTDTSVADGGNYFYVVYADNGYFCTPTVSGAVVTKATPGQASGTVTVANATARAASSTSASTQAEDLRREVSGHRVPIPTRQRSVDHRRRRRLDHLHGRLLGLRQLRSPSRCAPAATPPAAFCGESSAPTR